MQEIPREPTAYTLQQVGDTLVTATFMPNRQTSVVTEIYPYRTQLVYNSFYAPPFISIEPSDNYTTPYWHQLVIAQTIDSAYIFSKDEGQSWQSFNMPAITGQAHSRKLLAYTDQLVIAGSGNRLMGSIDQGQSWTEFTSDTATDYSKSFATISNKKIFLLAYKSAAKAYSLRYTEDSGKTMKLCGDTLKSKLHLIRQFFSTSTGIPVIITSSNSQPMIFHYDSTADELIGYPIFRINSNLASLYIINRVQDKLFVSDHGLYISTDLGQSFVYDPGSKANTIIHVAAIDSVLYGATDSGTVLENRTILQHLKKSNAPSASAGQQKLMPGDIFPDPVTGSSFNILVSSPEAEPISFNVTDISGKVCETYNTTTIAGDNTFSFTRLGLSRGVYIMNIKTDRFSVNRKFIISR